MRRVLMNVTLEPKDSKQPLFGKIFNPPIDALSDTDYETRLDLLPIDFVVNKLNEKI